MIGPSRGGIALLAVAQLALAPWALARDAAGEPPAVEAAVASEATSKNEERTAESPAAWETPAAPQPPAELADLETPASSEPDAPAPEADPASLPRADSPGLLRRVRNKTIEFGRNTAGDTVDILFSPMDWRAKEWLGFGAVALGTGLLFLADEPLDREIGERDTLGKDANRAIRFVGTGPGIAILTGGFAATGILLDRPKERETAWLLLESMAITQIFNASLKVSLGRARPKANQGHTEFDFFGKGRSLPSGETTVAFTMATVVSEQYPSWPLRILAYGGAATVGLARMDKRAHWSSDVFLSAALGTLVTKAVIYRHRKRERDKREGRAGPETTIVPAPGGLQVVVTY